MKLRVHLLEKPEEPFHSTLSAALLPDVSISWDENSPSEDCDILVSGVPNREQLTKSPYLKALIVPWAGLPWRTRELLIDFPDLLVYNLHYNDVETAETAVALMMACAKLIIPLDRGLRSHDWTLRYAPAPMLALNGKRALVLGYGAIGRQIAAICRGMGIDVTGIRRTRSDSNDAIYTIASLDQLLPRSDILFVTIPLTPETIGLVDRKRLALLPDDAIIVNVARGPVVDEEALFNSLKEGRLRAGLDVWYHYPPDESGRSHSAPSSFPFESLDNVVMTPHIAGHSTIIEEKRAAALAKLLNDLASGREVASRVNPEAGY